MICRFKASIINSEKYRKTQIFAQINLELNNKKDQGKIL
jgi:hypothetical protein